MILRAWRWFWEKLVGIHMHTWGEWREHPRGIKVYEDGDYLGVYRGWVRYCKDCNKEQTKV